MNLMAWFDGDPDAVRDRLETLGVADAAREECVLLEEQGHDADYGEVYAALRAWQIRRCAQAAAAVDSGPGRTRPGVAGRNRETAGGAGRDHRRQRGRGRAPRQTSAGVEEPVMRDEVTGERPAGVAGGGEARVKVVYIAGPFRGPNSWAVEQNIRNAENMAFEVASAGCMPLCPHTMTRFFNGTLTDEFWLGGALDLLRRCDAILLLPGWWGSVGSVAERVEAIRIGLPVLHGMYGCNGFVAWSEAGRPADWGERDADGDRVNGGENPLR